MESNKVKSQLRSDVHCIFTKSSSPFVGCSWCEGIKEKWKDKVKTAATKMMMNQAIKIRCPCLPRWLLHFCQRVCSTVWASSSLRGKDPYSVDDMLFSKREKRGEKKKACQERSPFCSLPAYMLLHSKITHVQPANLFPLFPTYIVAWCILFTTLVVDAASWWWCCCCIYSNKALDILKLACQRDNKLDTDTNQAHLCAMLNYLGPPV